MDIRYMTTERGFVYLAVVLDWFSRCPASHSSLDGSTPDQASSIRLPRPLHLSTTGPPQSECH